MKDLSVLTLRELEADLCAAEGRVEALEAAIAAKKAEPDLSEAAFAFQEAYWSCPSDDHDESIIPGLLAAYPALRKAMGDEPSEPDDGGWIKHDGGPCPVDGDTRVTLRFADGFECYSGIKAKDFSEGLYDWWRHENSSPWAKGIAYRVLP